MSSGKSESPGEATTAVAPAAEPTGLFPASPCPLPSRFWQVALEPPGELSPSEQEHLRECVRCRNHLARVLQAAQEPDDEDLDDEEALPEAEAAALVPALAARIGPYEVLAELGASGMGTVYKARDRAHGRLVALKVLPRGRLPLTATPGAWRTAARALARLAHPHLAQVYDGGEDRGRPFLACEYVEGWDLERRLGADGPLPAAVACDYVRQAALALDYLHASGVSHRDLKPANLLLTTTGHVKVTDFGLAAPARWSQPDPAGVRADLHGLGHTLYRLVTGRRADPTARGPQPDPALQRICRRCFEPAE